MTSSAAPVACGSSSRNSTAANATRSPRGSLRSPRTPRSPTPTPSRKTMTTSPSNVALRGYQVAACEAIQRGFTEYQRQLLVLPTGGGKTVVFAHLAAINQPRRTLVLAHREELIGQAVDKIRAVTGLTAEVEMADSHASFNAPVVVASVQ